MASPCYARSMPELTLAHSPDADDMVMWWPLLGESPAIDTGGFVFRSNPEDVERLNRLAITDAAPYDITAISAHAYPHCRSRYAVTACGGSFGEGYGPKLVMRGDSPLAGASVEHLAGRAMGLTVAVPGVHTTAFLTLSLAIGRFGHRELPFQEIIGAVSRGEVDAGLVIHEAQLTFGDAGLVAALDLGAWWHKTRGLPLPLGLNVVRRDLDERFGEGTMGRVSGVLSASVRHAVEHPHESREFLRARADDRPEWNDDALLERYLSMYVSGLTLDMGEPGREALRALLAEAHEKGLCPDPGPIDVV